MEISLKTPSITTDAGNRAKLDPALVSSDLKSLPQNDYLYTGHRVLADIEQLNQTAMDEEKLFKLLEIYRVYVLNLSKGLRGELGESPLPIAKKLLTRTTLTQQLHGELANGYKRLILQYLDVDTEKQLPSESLVTCCERAMFSLLQILTLSFLSYQPVPVRTWKELHQIYKLSHLRAFTNIGVSDIADSSKKLKIIEIYCFALLLDLSEPYTLPNGGLYRVLRLFPLWVGSLSLFDKHNLQGLRYFYSIDPDIDKGCLPFPEETPQGFLYITTDSLVHQMLGPKPPLMHPALEGNATELENITRTLLPKLIKSWTVYPVRRFHRTPATGNVDILFGLQAIHHGLSRTELEQSGRFPGHATHTWDISNESASGLGVEYHGHGIGSIQVGDLILYRETEASPEQPWHTGIIRWFNQLERSRLAMGIQRLSPGAEPGIAVRDQGDQSTRFQVIIYPSNPLLHSEATLIGPPGIFKSGRQFELTQADGSQLKIRAIKAHCVNPSIEQFSYEIMR